jgi:hypothetical protein
LTILCTFAPNCAQPRARRAAVVAFGSESGLTLESSRAGHRAVETPTYLSIDSPRLCLAAPTELYPRAPAISGSEAYASTISGRSARETARRLHALRSATRASPERLASPPQLSKRAGSAAKMIRTVAAWRKPKSCHASSSKTV